jgi:hypothetical protein
MPPLPIFLPIAFLATVAYTLWCFGRACGWHRRTFVVIGIWMLITAVLGITGFYATRDTIPPRPVFLLIPSLLLIIGLFATRSGRVYIDGLRPSSLVLLHTVRVPVELVLLGLYVYGAIPQLMTFEGANPDILTGLTAGLVLWLGHVRKVLPRWAMIAWHIGGLALLTNIVSRAVLAMPTPFQKFAFDEPAVGMLHYPYVWLPTVVVPLVLFAHLASLRQLLRSGVRGTIGTTAAGSAVM